MPLPFIAGLAVGAIAAVAWSKKDELKGLLPDLELPFAEAKKEQKRAPREKKVATTGKKRGPKKGSKGAKKVQAEPVQEAQILNEGE